MPDLRVADIVLDWNMSRRRVWMDEPKVKRLRHGQCILAVNRAGTMAQLVSKGPHGLLCMYWYPPQGTRVDLAGLEAAVKEGLLVPVQTDDWYEL
jgi:hypothetical protein